MGTYTRSEVAKHNKKGDIWFVIHNEVFNVSEFIKEHPGGQEVFLAAAGGDASECFDDIGHSEEAKNLKKKFKIGVISKHPGGEEVLLEQTAKDATEAFEDVGHSSDARELMAKYKVGEIIEAERKVVKEPTSKDWNAETESGSSGSWASWVIPVVFGLLATIVYRYFIVHGHRE